MITLITQLDAIDWSFRRQRVFLDSYTRDCPGVFGLLFSPHPCVHVFKRFPVHTSTDTEGSRTVRGSAEHENPNTPISDPGNVALMRFLTSSLKFLSQ